MKKIAVAKTAPHRPLEEGAGARAGSISGALDAGARRRRGNGIAAKYFHFDGQGTWAEFDVATCEVLEGAYQRAAPSVRIPPINGMEFEVRFGANATSERMPEAPATGMIQVNVRSGNTRVVRRDAPDLSAKIDANIALANTFSASSALYGWLLRKKLSGWRKGAWQRRFYVLAPRSSALLYFTKGLHTREVQLCRDAAPGAPQARGTIMLANAMILPAAVDDDRPHSFSVVVPGAEPVRPRPSRPRALLSGSARAAAGTS